MLRRGIVINTHWISLLIIFQGIIFAEAFADSALKNIVCLGQIVPGERVMHVAVPAGSIIDKINVRRGEQVKSGAVLARLRGWEIYEAKVAHAEQSVKLAKADLQEERKGERKEVIVAQKAFIAAQKLEVDLFQQREKRYGVLRKTNSISLAEYEKANAELGMAKARLQRQTSILNGFLSGRLEDIAQFEIKVKLAEAKLKEAQASLKLQYIRAPLSGEILDVLVYPGELVKDFDAVVTMGDTKNMMVLAEVYETDIMDVQVGDKAQISSRGLDKKFEGKVVEIQHCLEGGRIFALNPSAYVDRRIVLVHIRPDNSAAFASFSNAQVSVTISVTGKK